MTFARSRAPRAPRAYALMLVIGISMTLAIGVGTMLSYLAAAAKNSGRQRLNREAFYVCDGIGRVITKSTAEALADTTLFTDPANLAVALRQRVESALGPELNAVLPPTYGLGDSNAFSYRSVDATETLGTVGSGRYGGLTGGRRTFTFDLELKKANGPTCSTTATVDTIRVPFGELAVFSTESLRYCPSWVSEDVTRLARYHVNGDLTVAGPSADVPAILGRTTITGDLDTLCGPGSSSATRPVRFCFGSACATSDDSTPDALAAAEVTTDLFSDQTRGASTLTLSASLHRAQHGVKIGDNQVGAADTRNDTNFRFLVDPGFQSDAADVKALKLAQLAQVRIIDGVWYINDGSWPGTPVWSDHPEELAITAAAAPEEFAIVGNVKVGQKDLYPTGTLPTRYSAFEGPAVSEGVVSYGVLHRPSTLAALPEVWVPGELPAAPHLGFVDMHAQRDAVERVLPGNGNILPLNFDLGAFINAALDESGAELGAQLAAANITNRDLLVWIGVTWPGSLQGLIGDAAAIRPLPAPTLLPGTTNNPLPYPMCQAGVAADSPRNCAAARRPNAVRVFNAGAALPSNRRITIASSLPMYVLGSVDREPAAATGRPSPANLPPSSPVFPTDYILDDGPDVFFAADSVTLLSDQWQDNDRLWGLPDTGAVERTSTPITAYNASILTGRTINGSSKIAFGLERSMRFLETWETGQKQFSPIVTGSILVGFRSVYAVGPVCYAPDFQCNSDTPWRHFWSKKLATTLGQPPGMPSFSLQAQGETIPDSFEFNFFGFLNFAPSLVPSALDF